MTTWGVIALSLAGAFVGGLTIKAVLAQARPQRKRHLGLVSECWRGFERADEERHVEELRHRP